MRWLSLVIVIGDSPWSYSDSLLDSGATLPSEDRARTHHRTTAGRAGTDRDA